MFWIPGISILVFFLILIPSTILGYKKGWRGAVFVSLLLLSFTGIWIGVGYLMYDSFLWPLYRDSMLSKDLKVSGLNLDSLRETFQLRIVLMFTGILTPLSYLFVYIIWKLSSEKINKYMGPKTKDVSDYEKQVIYRKSTVASRSAGVVIMGATTLFISSLAASAVSVMTVPYSRRDGITKFNDTLGNLYGFGKVGNTDTASALQSFMKEIDHEMIEALQEMAKIGTDTSARSANNNFKVDVARVNTLFNGNNKMRWGVLNELMQDNHEAGAMFIKMALESISIQLINNPLKWDSLTNSNSLDTYGNIIGFGESRTFLLDDLKNYLHNNKLTFKFNEEAISAFINYYENNIVNYSETVFARKKVEKEKEISQLTSTLEKRTNNLASSEEKLVSIQKEIFDNVQLVKQISGQEYDHQTIDPTTAGHTIKSFTYDKYTMKPAISSPVAGTQLAEATNRYSTALNLFNTFKNTQYDPAKQALEHSFNALQALSSRKATLEAEVRTAESHVQSAQGILDSRQRELAQAERDRQNAGNEKNRLDQLKHSKESLVIQNTNTISSLTTAISGLETTNTQLHSEVTTLTNSLNAKKAELQTAEAPASGLPDQDHINSLKSEIASLELQIRNKNSSINQNQSTIDSKTIEKNNLTTANINLNTEIVNLGHQITAQENIVTTSTNKINTLQGNGTTSIHAAQTDLQQSQTQLSAKKDALHDFITNQYNPADAQYKNDLRIFNSLKQRYDQLDRDQIDAKNAMDALTQKLQETKDKIDQDNQELGLIVDVILKLIADKVTWDPTMQTTTTHVDDDSIVFIRKEIQYQNVVLKNITDIYNAKLQIYNDNKKELISIYSNWLRGK